MCCVKKEGKEEEGWHDHVSRPSMRWFRDSQKISLIKLSERLLDWSGRTRWIFHLERQLVRISFSFSLNFKTFSFWWTRSLSKPKSQFVKQLKRVPSRREKTVDDKAIRINRILEKAREKRVSLNTLEHFEHCSEWKELRRGKKCWKCFCGFFSIRIVPMIKMAQVSKTRTHAETREWKAKNKWHRFYHFVSESGSDFCWINKLLCFPRFSVILCNAIQGWNEWQWRRRQSDIPNIYWKLSRSF